MTVQLPRLFPLLLRLGSPRQRRLKAKSMRLNQWLRTEGVLGVGGVARLCRPGDHDVEPGVHTRIQVPRRLGRQRPSSDQVLEVMGPHDELA